MSQVYISTEPHQLPIIYREEYNVHFGGIEKLHPFDAAKWGHIFQVGCILSCNYNEDEAVCRVIYEKRIFMVCNTDERKSMVLLQRDRFVRFILAISMGK